MKEELEELTTSWRYTKLQLLFKYETSFGKPNEHSKDNEANERNRKVSNPCGINWKPKPRLVSCQTAIDHALTRKSRTALMAMHSASTEIYIST